MSVHDAGGDAQAPSVNTSTLPLPPPLPVTNSTVRQPERVESGNQLTQSGNTTVHKPNILPKFKITIFGASTVQQRGQAISMQHRHQTISVWQSATEVGAAEVSATEVGTAKVNATEVGTAEVSATELGTADVSATEVGTADVSATEVVNRIQRNTCDVSLGTLVGALVGALVALAATNQFVTKLRSRTLGETVTHTGI